MLCCCMFLAIISRRRQRLQQRRRRRCNIAKNRAFLSYFIVPAQAHIFVLHTHTHTTRKHIALTLSSSLSLVPLCVRLLPFVLPSSIAIFLCSFFYSFLLGLGEFVVCAFHIHNHFLFFINLSYHPVVVFIRFFFCLILLTYFLYLSLPTHFLPPSPTTHLILRWITHRNVLCCCCCCYFY